MAKTEIITNKRYDSLKFHPIAFAMTDTLITVIPIILQLLFAFLFDKIKVTVMATMNDIVIPTKVM